MWCLTITKITLSIMVLKMLSRPLPHRVIFVNKLLLLWSFFPFLFYFLNQKVNAHPLYFWYFDFSPYSFYFYFFLGHFIFFFCFQFSPSITIYQMLCFLIRSLFFWFLFLFLTLLLKFHYFSILFFNQSLWCFIFPDLLLILLIFFFC